MAHHRTPCAPSHTTLSHTHPTRDSKRRQACNPAYSERYHDHIRAPSRIQSPPSKFRRSLVRRRARPCARRTPHCQCARTPGLNPQRESSRGKPGKAFMWGERHVTVWVRPRTVAGRTNISLHEAHAYKSQLTLQRFMWANSNLRAKESHLTCTRKLWHA